MSEQLKEKGRRERKNRRDEENTETGVIYCVHTTITKRQRRYRPTLSVITKTKPTQDGQ